jgi:photosystem II stability/assembly factor-like uncharacterized protein
MNRFEKVVEIIDNAVGGPVVPVGFHGAFWRGVSRSDFVTKSIFGLPLISVGDGANSNLVKALKGESPFGADVGNPDADFNRMPSGLPPVPSEDIAFIQRWIDEGCLEDELEAKATLAWRRTAAPSARRHDDVWFVDALIGWAVNSDGHIIKTTDGGLTWVLQQSTPGVYLRCLGFAGASIGWVGTLTRSRRLYHTVDGGATWAVVTPLPVEAPVAVCGLSVVSAMVVYASGTNRPTDVPAMMKTLDGGATWTAWNMSAHASILVDTCFVDALHGWVVGGKADESTPTTRDKLKPVVLETTDGGLTWVNRLAGHEAQFPFGEWGWKIQFLDDKVGFVSLENFSEAAILKTTNGGQTWIRLKVNDQQGNANLEGIGFINESQGWVGGWGGEDFTKGSSSATIDGGANWRDANEIGLFLNRFRFLGKPVTLGYASGDTIYKYSAETAAPHAVAGLNVARDSARLMLPEAYLVRQVSAISIPLNVPAGAKRLTLHAWNRFGEEVGCVLDEIRPVDGRRVFSWSGNDPQGKPVLPGDYLIRLTIDDVSVSSFLRIQDASSEKTRVRALGSRRLPKFASPHLRLHTVSALVAAPTHDLDWLRNALQIAIQLELATLPPYLTARWTIKNPDPVSRSIFEIRSEEMLHFGLACNLLSGIDGAPLLADEKIIPKYPGSLPGGVRPGLTVTLRKLSREQAGVFMEIEYPQAGPVTHSVSTATIGDFYVAILAAFRALNPVLLVNRQLDGPLGLFKIDSLAKVEQAIQLINLQGEGTNASPEETAGDLAHYYRFGEIHYGRKLIRDAAGGWVYNGDEVPLPDVHDMADIPAGGYQQADVPDIAVWELIQRFDDEYSSMLRLLQDAWTHGDGAILGEAIKKMMALGRTGRTLVTKTRPDGRNYGPCFRFVP